VTNDPKDAGEAILAIELAWRRYPTNAILMADLSFAHEAAKDSKAAQVMAIKALKQDDLNHERQHVDRYLEESIRMKLEKLANLSTTD
jgi:hypothetical protein